MLFLPFRASTVTYDHVRPLPIALQGATRGSVRQLRIWIETKDQKAKAYHEWLISFELYTQESGLACSFWYTAAQLIGGGSSSLPMIPHIRTYERIRASIGAHLL